VEIERARLLDRLAAGGARLFRFLAPAGYGKTTLARQLATRHGGRAVICDCSLLDSAGDLARRVVAAIATIDSRDAEAWAREQLTLHDQEADWRALADRAWCAADKPTVFIFENAEDIPDGGALKAAFDALLAKPMNPASITVVCSRRAFVVPYSAGLSPHEVSTITAGDLRFDEEEISAILRGANLHESSAKAIANVSQGWPIVVLLFARFASEGSVDRLLSRLDNIAFEDLYEYIASQLLNELDSIEMDILTACAATEHITAAELTQMFGNDAVTSAIDTLEKRIPFTYHSRNDRFEVHPIIKSMLWKRRESRCRDIVGTVAEACERRGDNVRSAQLHLSLRDQVGAARAIKDVGPYLVSTPSIELSSILSALNQEVLTQFPALWCAAIIHRGYSMPPQEWIASARAMWVSFKDGEPGNVRSSVFSTYLNGLVNVGSFDEAHAELEQFVERLLPNDVSGQAVAHVYRAALDSYSGHYDRLDGLEEQLAHLFAASDITHCLVLYDVVSPKYLARGEKQRNVQTLDRAWQIGKRVKAPVGLIVAVNAAFSAWFHGDDERFDWYLGELEAAVTPGVMRGHRLFLECARGRGRGVPYGYEKLRARCEALLIASSLSDDVEEARTFAGAALEAAMKSSRPFYEVLSLVALAELEKPRRDECLHKASAIAQQIDSGPLRKAIFALTVPGRDAGMLQSFVDRYGRFTKEPVLQVNVFAAQVFKKGTCVALPRRELALILALARHPRWYHAEELISDLFPELDRISGQNRLYVYIHRTRKRLGDEGVIRTGPAGFRLGDTVSVDIWNIEIELKRAQAVSKILDEKSRKSLTDLYARCQRSRPAALLYMDFFEALERRIIALRHDVSTLLARDAIARQDVPRALALSKQMIEDDQWDEVGYETAIRAYLLEHNEASAFHVWRIYRDLSISEFGVEPHGALGALVAKGAV
jgi:DNA-binding SARP family transcriptional activator